MVLAPNHTQRSWEGGQPLLLHSHSVCEVLLLSAAAALEFVMLRCHLKPMQLKKPLICNRCRCSPFTGIHREEQPLTLTLFAGRILCNINLSVKLVRPLLLPSIQKCNLIDFYVTHTFHWLEGRLMVQWSHVFIPQLKLNRHSSASHSSPGGCTGEIWMQSLLVG